MVESEVRQQYEDPAEILLIQASDILDELQHNRPLRDAFFPDDSISRAMKVREILNGDRRKNRRRKRNDHVGICSTIPREQSQSRAKTSPRFEYWDFWEHQAGLRRPGAISLFLGVTLGLTTFREI